MKNQGESSESTANLRREAEKRLLEKNSGIPEDISTFSPEKNQAVLHELHVHQIELEMQNEDLRRAQLGSSASRARYFDLYDLAPVGYITLSDKGVILQANLTAVKLLGVKRGDLTARMLSLFILKEDQDIFYLLRRQLMQTKQPQTGDLRMLKKDGSFFWAQMEATGVQPEELESAGYPDTDGPPKYDLLQFRIVLVDITERKQAEEKIRQLNTQLENRVIERTAELAQANHLLEEKVAQLEKYHENLSYLFTKYRVVADNTYDWEYWLDTDDRFVYSSPSCKRISGYDAEQFLQDSSLLWRLVHPDDLSIWWQHKSAVDTGKNVEKVTVRFIRADGSIRWIGHVCQSVYDKNGQYLGNRGSNRDITEQKLAEDALNREVKRSQTLARISSKLNTSLELQEIMDMVCEELAKMLDAPVAMVWLVDEQGKFLHMRAAFGLTPEIFEQVVPFPNQFFRSREEKYRNIYYGRDIQLDINAPNFKITEVLGVHTILNSWFFDQDKGIGLLSVLRYEIGWEYSDTDYSMLDTIRNQVAITIHKAQLYEQVRAARTRLAFMSEKLIEVQEAERRSLALELHDQLGQMLSSTKLSLDIIPSLPTDKAADQLQRASDLIGDLIARVRRMALDLRPSMLDDMGLFPTLRWFFRSYQQQTGETVTFDHSGLDRRFQPQVEITAFRIVQEALTNVIRHADNKQVVVKAWADETSLNLQIRDFGTGFDPQISLKKNESSGLSGMRECARLLGGELIIESQPGSGTNLTARLPLAIQYEHT